MDKLLTRLKEYRENEPVRFDAYLRRGVIAIAATAGIALDVEVAGFITGLIIYVAWGVVSTEVVRSNVTPTRKTTQDTSVSNKDSDVKDAS